MRTVLSLVLLACVVFAASDDELRIIRIDRIHPDTDAVVSPSISYVNTTSERLGVDINTLVRIGKALWDIISDGKSVVNLKVDWSGAIPKDTSASSLTGWRDATWGTFGWTFTNVYGMETVRFMWNFVFNCRGAYNGKGAFLTNVGTGVKEIYAAWGFTVDVTASVDSTPVNYGTAVDPIAGLQIEVTLKVSSVLQSFTERCRVAVRGDCTGSKIAC